MTCEEITAGDLSLSPAKPSTGGVVLVTRSIRSLTSRLRQAGFGKEFVDGAILPDWWDQSCLDEPNLLPEIEIRVSRFLAVPMSIVTDPEAALAAPGYPVPDFGVCVTLTRSVSGQRSTPQSALRALCCGIWVA